MGVNKKLTNPKQREGIMQKIIKTLLVLTVSVVMSGVVWGQIIAWETAGLSGNETFVKATTNDANLDSSILTRGSGITASKLADAFSSDHFTQNGSRADAITNDNYLQLSIKVQSGYKVSFSTLDANFRRSDTGPNTFQWQYSSDGFTTTGTDIGSEITYTESETNGKSQTQINLSGISELQNVESGDSITIRLYGWGATSTSGSFAIGRLSGNDLAIEGTVVPVSTLHYRSKNSGNWSDTSTWETSTDLSTWDNSTSAPTYSDLTITIHNGHIITITDSVTADQITIESGGQLIISSGQTLTLNNGPGTDMVINGTLLNSGTFTATNKSSWSVNSEGTYIHNTSTAFATTLNAVSLDNASKFIWRRDNPLIANRTYGNMILESESGNWSISSSGSTPLTINGNLSIGGSGAGTVAYSTSGFSGEISVAGNVTINSGSSLILGSSTILIGGNWSNSGTFNPGTSTIVFNGSTAQFYSQSGTGTLNNLTINNSKGMTINHNLNVDKTLTLTSGNITTGENVLILKFSASGGSSSSFVNGKLAYIVESSSPAVRIFPIGKGTAYRQTVISITQDASTATTYTAEVFNSAPISKALPGTIDKVSSVRYWHIQKGEGANVTSASITLYYDTDDGVNDPTNLRIVKDDGLGNWIDIGGSGSGSPSGFISSSTNFVSFSDFTLANASGGDNSLPISLESFTGILMADGVLLTWTTASEVENLGFILEKKILDAPAGVPGGTGNWILVADYTNNPALTGHGSTSEKHEYQFTDKAIQPGATYYYRLADADYSGKITWHKAVEVKVPVSHIPIPEKFSLSAIYPNPFNSSFTIPITLPETQLVKIVLYDCRGQVAQTLENRTLPAGAYKLNYTIGDLSSGIYFIKITAGTNCIMRKVALMK